MLKSMTQPDHTTHGQAAAADIEPLLAAFGIVVTEEGKARARRRFVDAEARWPEEAWSELDEALRADHAA
jgi:hypothetical protein